MACSEDNCLVAKNLKNELLNVKEQIKYLTIKSEKLEKTLNLYITKTETQDVKIESFVENFKKIERIGYAIVGFLLMVLFKELMLI